MSDEIIYPRKKVRRQRLIVVGTREEGDPALITCWSACSSLETLWTEHTRVQGSLYECTVCKNRRQWGLQYWSMG